ncbi:alpha/beta hydrolase [Streptomyces acidiscabies]|uniref:alpha/beta hydrolase n=1 Tax=Streptomyces acidiscabies TaxID=42234 RepID=UPI0038F6B73A
MLFDTEAVSPAGRPHTTVVWLHGLGQDAASLIPFAHRTGLTAPDSGIRHVFVTAPRQSPGLTGDTPARAWFHQRVYALDHADIPMLLSTERALADLITAESATVGPGRVVLAGFSQGACMSLVTALRHPARLGGLVLYDPYLPSGFPLATTRSPANTGLPVWIGQGRYDWIVPLFIGEEIRDLLSSWGHPVTWREYHDYPNTHQAFSGAETDVRGFVQGEVGAGRGTE